MTYNERQTPPSIKKSGDQQQLWNCSNYEIKILLLSCTKTGELTLPPDIEVNAIDTVIEQAKLLTEQLN